MIEDDVTEKKCN